MYNLYSISLAVNICLSIVILISNFLTNDCKFQLIFPTAFDDAGIRMLDSIREIFDILNIEFESIGFDFFEYENIEKLTAAIKNGKCPILDILKEWYSSDTDGSHAMVATGIKEEDGVNKIQLKNSFADDPKEKGKVLFNCSFCT